jgi:hypothetical protein
MPFIQQAIADARESNLVPEAEYDLRIADYEEKDSKKSGKPMISVMIEILNQGEDVEPIFHNISLVTDEDEPKTAKFKLRMQRRFLNVFNIPFEDNGFNTDDFANAEGRCLVVQQEREDRNGNPTGDFQHALRLPKFDNEPNDDTAQAADEAQAGTRAAARDTGRATRAGTKQAARGRR